MKKNKELYFCNQCKAIVNSIDDLFIVDNGPAKAYCSEDCIKKYFTPIINYLESAEVEAREKFQLENEFVLSMPDMGKISKKCLDSADKIFRYNNILKDEFYTFIKEVEYEDEAYFILIQTLVCDYEPSFLLFQTISQNEELILSLAFGSLIDNIDDFKSGSENAKETPPSEEESIMIDKSIAQELELLKSEYLAKLLEYRKDVDIDYESFHLYDKCFKPTLQDADEIYDLKKDDRHIVTYIKSFNENNLSYFYFVICLKTKEAKSKNDEILLPILSFPSLDGDLYHQYKQGEKLLGSLKN